MTKIHTENAFETAIEAHLLAHGPEIQERVMNIHRQLSAKNTLSTAKEGGYGER